jgi:hypothetical protein
MLRLNWFKSTWRDFDDWHKKAEYSLNKMFDKYSAATSDSQEDEIEAKQQHQRRKLPASYANNPLAAVMQVDLAYFHGNHGSKRRKRENELANYIDDLNEDFNRDDDYQELMADPWRWWLKIGRNRYPTLFKMAVDFLSIPSTSCECERCFSTAGRTLSTDRNLLSPTTIEALQLQKNWLKNRVVKSSFLRVCSHVTQKASTTQLFNSLNFSN